MNTVGKMKSFVKQFIAKIEGDDATVRAEKALRQADSALKTQIATLTGDTINLEDAVEAAKEAQANARINNAEPITDREYYVQKLLGAKNDVTEAQEELDTHKAKIAFLASELASLSEETAE
jgi:hypothetical protein